MKLFLISPSPRATSPATRNASTSTWAALSVIFWLLAFRFDSAWLGRAGRIATGALMLLAAAAHLALRGGATSADAVAWIVNAGFLIGGLALLAPDFRRKTVAATPAAML